MKNYFLPYVKVNEKGSPLLRITHMSLMGNLLANLVWTFWDWMSTQLQESDWHAWFGRLLVCSLSFTYTYHKTINNKNIMFVEIGIVLAKFTGCACQKKNVYISSSIEHYNCNWLKHLKNIYIYIYIYIYKILTTFFIGWSLWGFYS